MGLVKTLSLFAGAGGLDFGFERAGFETCIAIDSDDSCQKVLRSNTAWRVPADGDVSNWTAKRLKKEASLGRQAVQAIIAGPPCQPFSKAAYWHSGDAPRLKDERSKTLDALLSLVEGLLPEVVVIENVPGIAFDGKDEAMRKILRKFSAINRSTNSAYLPVASVIDAADFGVPQHRKRLFIVAARSGVRFTFPQPTHGEGRIPYVNCWDAFSGLVEPEVDRLQLTGKWKDVIPSIPEGNNYLWHTSRGGGFPLFGWRTRYWSFLLKLAKNLPSWTISASPGSATGPFHWLNRRLSVDELKRLQTFPDSIQFDCGYRDAVRMIGNAVPSLLAEVLAREISSQVFGCKVQGKPELSIKQSNSVPGPERVRSLPSAFRTHVPPPDHAGEGAGPGALLRKHKPKSG